MTQIGEPSPSRPDHDDVWVIVPVFNEEPVVRGVLEGILAHFPRVVAVDDGSSDGSVEQIRATSARLVRHPFNMGAGAALQTGVEFALQDPQMRWCVLIDADGQHDVADAVAMVARVREEGQDVLFGSRFLGVEALDMSAGRRLVLRAARLFERLHTGIALTDAHQGLRVFGRSFAQVLQLRAADMAWASEFLHRVAEVGATYAEHPVTVRYTDYSRGKGQRTINSVNIGLDVLFQRVIGRRR